MFAYCGNCPIQFIDSCGCFPVFASVNGEDGIEKTPFKEDKKPYYDSIDDAAKVAGNTESKETSRTNAEYGHGIYRDPENGKYYIGDMVTGGHDYVDVPTHNTENLVAFSHSHPNCICHDGEHFSWDDCTVAIDAGIIIYLATPSGQQYRYTPCYCIKLENQHYERVNTDLYKHKNRYFTSEILASE